MQLALRLYYPIDADLIAIRLWERRNFTKLIREKLTKLLDPAKETMNDRDIYTLPEDIKRYVRAIKEPVKVNLNLKEGRDDIIICYLKQIRPSIRGDTVKFLFRMCFNTYPNDLFPMDLFLNFKKTRIIQSSKSNTSASLVSRKEMVKFKRNEKNKVSGLSQKKSKKENVPQKSTDLKENPETSVKNTSLDFESGKSETKDPEISEKPKKESIIEQVISENTSSGNGKGNLSENNHPENNSSALPAVSDEETDNAAYEMFSNLLGY